MNSLVFTYLTYKPKRLPKMSEKVVDTVTYTFSIGAITFGALTAQELAAFLGVVIAGAAYITGFIFKVLHYRLAMSTASYNLKRRKEDKGSNVQPK